MKKIYYLLLFFNSLVALAQSDFDRGFKNGYKEGFCFNKSTGCIAPTTPITPIPSINENLNSIIDGYNRGFKMGLEAQKNNTNSTNTSERTRYQTSDPKFVDDKMSKTPIDFYMKAMELTGGEIDFSPRRRRRSGKDNGYSIDFGVNIGSNINNQKTSILLGLFLEANISKRHSFIIETMFFQDQAELTPIQSRFNSIAENETKYEDENVFQGNLLLKYSFSKRFHFKYGVGASVSTTYDLASINFIGGLQYNITSNLFADIRINQQIYNFTDETVFEVENMENIEISPLNFQVSLGYKF